SINVTRDDCMDGCMQRGAHPGWIWIVDQRHRTGACQRLCKKIKHRGGRSWSVQVAHQDVGLGSDKSFWRDLRIRDDIYATPCVRYHAGKVDTTRGGACDHKHPQRIIASL